MFCKTCLFPNTKPDIDFDLMVSATHVFPRKRKHGLINLLIGKKREKFKKF